MDWFSRMVLAWRLSNTMDVEFCTEALKEAMAKHGRPDIFNTDQGSQFTSPRFTELLRDASVRLSMDGRGRWLDNVFIKRLWRVLVFAVATRRDDGLAALLIDEIVQAIGIVGPVGQHLLCRDAPYEVTGRSHVILLTGAENEADRQAQGIDYGMDFRAEPAS